MKPYANGRLTNHGTTRDGGSGSVKAAEVLQQHLEQLDVSLGPHGSSRPKQVVFAGEVHGHIAQPNGANIEQMTCK